MKILLSTLKTQKIRHFRVWDGFLNKEKPTKGILKAHQNIVAWAKTEQLSSITIAEDDIAFSAPGAFQWYLQNEPSSYDLYLGGITYGKIGMDNSVDDFAGTHLYTIHHMFFDHFLSLTGDNNFDRALAGSGKFLVCNPMVAYQIDGFSDNTRTHRRYGAYMKNRIWWTGKHPQNRATI